VVSYLHLKGLFFQTINFQCTICDICERPLTSVTNMLRHRLTHKSVEERSFKCTVCNKVMVNENSLKYHMRTHDTLKPFVCDVCGMGFGTSWGLKVGSVTIFMKNLFNNPNIRIIGKVITRSERFNVSNAQNPTQHT
jgi:RNase P subunit RPR2